MPIRKIPRSHRNVTGRRSIPGARSVAFESPLERDFILVSQFTPGFFSIEEQPVQLTLPTGNRYTPDFLVTWEAPRRPSLVEVKPSDKVATLGAKRIPAARYAASRGWKFEIATEKEIRTPRLANARFLLPFRNHVPDPEKVERIRSVLQGVATPIPVSTLLDFITSKRELYFPAVWHLERDWFRPNHAVGDFNLPKR